LTHRRNLKRKFLDLENAIRHSLKTFGIRIKGCGRGGFAQAVREAVAGDAWVAELIDAMLNARAALWKEYGRLHDLVVKFVAGHELCRRFMQIPGVGPVAALSFVTAIDDPSRFKRSRDVAAYFGLTSRRWQSGSSIDVQGRISKAGDSDVRRALYEAASALLTRFKRKDKVKSWGLAIARQALLAPQGDGGGGAQAGRDYACDVGRRHVLLWRSGGNTGGGARARRREGTQASQDQRMIRNSGFADQ
jgi:transposase